MDLKELKAKPDLHAGNSFRSTDAYRVLPPYALLHLYLGFPNQSIWKCEIKEDFFKIGHLFICNHFSLLQTRRTFSQVWAEQSSIEVENQTETERRRERRRRRIRDNEKEEKNKRQQEEGEETESRRRNTRVHLFLEGVKLLLLEHGLWLRPGLLL